jgi:hypothetical protein
LPGSSKFKGVALGLLLVIIATGIFLLTYAPHERTLGPGILPVYVHVSLTWTGTLFFILSAIAGITELLRNKDWHSWVRPLFMAAFITYMAGFLVSLWASYVNWGGIPFQEPRIISAFNVVAVASVCALLMVWQPRKPLTGIAAIIPAVFIIFGVQNTRLVLHPDNPIWQAPLSIRYTFISMFGIALLLGIWLVWAQRIFVGEKAGN